LHNDPALEAIDRRRFLQLMAGMAAVTLTTACDAGPIAASGALARPELLDALGAERVRDPGRRYREMTASERDAASLEDAIRRSLPLSARLSGGTPAHVAHLVHDDFEAGRTVVVSGWILSATEARQCALFSLLAA
jgi:hypothetical protein